MHEKCSLPFRAHSHDGISIEIAKITLEYSIFTNKSTTRMNIEWFQIPCLFHPTLWV